MYHSMTSISLHFSYGKVLFHKMGTTGTYHYVLKSLYRPYCPQTYKRWKTM